MYKTIKDYSIRSCNFYNYANYMVRQAFTETDTFLNYQFLQKYLKDTDPYKRLMSQSAQCQLRLLEKNWKSFFNGMEEWKKNPSKFLGMPKLPNYKKKGSKHIWLLKNNQTYIKDGRLYFKLKCMNGYSFKTSVTDRLISVRFVPRNDVFVMEIVYEQIIEEKKEINDKFVSIDVGTNNFITMIDNIGNKPVIVKGGIIKSINQFYNKQRAKYSSNLTNNTWSKRLDTIDRKRFNRIKNCMHHCSKFVIEYCKKNNVETIIIGHNKKQKNGIKIGKKNNQEFVQIPFNMFIMQLQYKGLHNGIRVIVTEENYTSGTSFLDNELPIKENYNYKRRISRGMFKSNAGKLINADVNSAYQIAKKVFPNAFADGIEVCLTPISLKNVINQTKFG